MPLTPEFFLLPCDEAFNKIIDAGFTHKKPAYPSNSISFVNAVNNVEYRLSFFCEAGRPMGANYDFPTDNTAELESRFKAINAELTHLFGKPDKDQFTLHASKINPPLKTTTWKYRIFWRQKIRLDLTTLKLSENRHITIYIERADR